MSWWEDDPIVALEEPPEDRWWEDDPIVGEAPQNAPSTTQSEIGGVERSALNALQFGINSSAVALDYKNQYEEESPEWLTGVPKPSRYTKLAELETAFESTPKGYKSKGGIPVWENTGREMAMERTRVKVAEQEAAKAREKFLKSGLSPDEYAQKLENERLLRTQRTAKLPAPARWVANFFLDFGDGLFGMAAQVVNDQDQAKYHFKDIAERHAAARVGLGPVGTLIEDVAGVLADAIVIGGTGGGAGLATYYGGKTSAELYTETGNAAYAATGGLIEGVATMAGFKLGAGSARLAKYVGGAGSGDILSNAAKRALKRVGAPSWMRTAAPLLTGPTGEIVGETATDLGHAFNAYLLNGEGDAFTNWANNAPYTALVAGTAGFAGSSVETSKRSYDINSRKELARNMKRVADEIKQASKGIESAVTVIESQPETAKEPIPVPPTSRNGFEKATGQTRTSEAQREAHAETISEYNKARDDFFNAVDTLSAEQSAEETAAKAKELRKRSKEWVGRDYTDYAVDKNGKERARKVADPELTERLNGLIESDPELAEGILDTAKSVYSELGEDTSDPLRASIRSYFKNNRSLSSFRSKVKRAGDPAGVKGFDKLMAHLRESTSEDQLSYRGSAESIDEAQVFDLLKYGWDRNYTGKARALRKALDYYDDQMSRPGQAEPTSDGGFASEPEQVVAPEQQPTQAPESPPAASQPEVAPVQPEAVEVRPEAIEAVQGAIHDAIPGSRLTPRSPGEFQVDLPNGRFFTLKLEPEIKTRSSKYLKFLLKVNGLEDTKANRDRIRNQGGLGRFTIATEDGVLTDGLGVMQILDKLDKPRMTLTARHEAVHVARAFGLFTDQEWDALTKEHSDPAKPLKQQEEDIAKASKLWKGDNSLRTRIKDLLNRFLTFIRFTALNPQVVQRSFLRGEQFTREGKRNKQAVSEAAMQSNDALSMEQIDDEVPIWTHASRRIVEQKMGAKSNPIAVMAMLKNNGVKEEEIEWMGLKELLGNNRKSVTKEEVLAAIEQGVRVEEVVKGENFKLGTPEEMYDEQTDTHFWVVRDTVSGEIVGEGHTPDTALSDAGYSIPNTQNSTKFSQWQLPGGENYRELLLTLPAAIPQEMHDRYNQLDKIIAYSSDDAERERAFAERDTLQTEMLSRSKKNPAFHSSHFDEPNILAHIRFNERTDAEGKRVLFIEEIQSDWHQQGKKTRYVNPRMPFGLVGFSEHFATREEAEAFADSQEVTHGLIRDERTEGSKAAFVPDAPFKKSWPLLSMKRMIRWAADNGFDRIAWTTGAQQAERYDLSKQVDSIKVESVEEAEGVFFVDIKPSSGQAINLEVENGIVREGEFEGKPLDEVIGKEMANKILAVPPGNTQTFSGEGLKMGGEGMHGFYDRILPAETNKFIKKWGAKVGRTRVKGEKTRIGMEGSKARIESESHEAHVFDITESMRDSAVTEGLSMFSLPESDDSLSEGGGPIFALGLNPRATSVAGKLARDAKSFLKDHFTSPGNKGKEFQRIIEVAKGDVTGHLRQLNYLMVDLKRAAKKAGLFHGNTVYTAAAQRMDDVLKGATQTTLPAEVVAPLRAMRDSIDALSRSIIASGLAGPDLELTIDNNLGTYITRTYRKHNEPGYLEEFMRDPQKKADALRYLSGQFPQASQSELTARLQILLYKDSLDEKNLPPSMKADRKFMNILKQRQNLDQELRDIYGEYRDPFINATNTVGRIAQLVATYKMGNEIKQAGIAAGVITDAGTPVEGLYAKIDGNRTPALRVLDGLFTTPEIKNALEDEFNNTPLPALGRAVMFLSAMAKGAVTVGYFPKGAIRNFLGNPLISLRNGVNPLRMLGPDSGLPTVWRDVSGRANAAQRAELVRLSRLHLLDSDVQLNEFKALLRPDTGIAALFDPESPLVKAPTKSWQVAAATYRSADAAWKVMQFYALRKKYGAALPHLSDAELDNYVADIVLQLNPTYMRSPKGVRTLAKMPLFAPFLTFFAEVVRTQKNALSIGMAEVKSGNPKLVRLGAAKLAGFMTAPLVIPAISELTKMMFGVSDDEDKDLRRLQSEWSRNSPMIYTGRGKDGTPNSIDASFIDPFQVFSKPVYAALVTPESEQGRAWDTLAEAASPVTNEDIFMQRVFDVMRNRTQSGREVYSESATPVEKTRQIVLHMGDALIPATTRSIGKLNKAAKGELGSHGQRYELKEEIIGALIARSSSVDVPTSTYYRQSEFSTKMQAAQRDVLKLAMSGGTVDLEELEKLYNERNTHRKAVFNQWHGTMGAVRRLGLAEKEITQQRKTLSISNDLGVAVDAGHYRPYFPSESTIRAMQSKPDGANRVKALRKAYLTALLQEDYLADEKRSYLESALQALVQEETAAPSTDTPSTP